MKKWLVPSLLIAGIILFGCSDSNKETDGEKPPQAMVDIGDQSYETTLGSYCWKSNDQSTCVDMAGPKELLKGKEPIKVKSGENITFVMNYEPQPNEFHVLQISESSEVEVNVEDNRFSAPLEEGVFYYSYGVWWMDEQEERVSNGDAVYNFALKVE
ncbi:hypothetical protein NC661_17115 [Aquibacillus koreensis]|uniref:Lipoprotein n=1 Tax=Aquibacillus koreensis TaxID=279446 RepID=A0A9X3WL35_9BACI|nr:hypothetical protein [Aquibacillus koreensis]MCT2536157.1 hypothetical protein [Aquibacillus koreensis]MDC3422082.1 hypothetical protein [Aquibacillus koreensis]